MNLRIIWLIIMTYYDLLLWLIIMTYYVLWLTYYDLFVKSVKYEMLCLRVVFCKNPKLLKLRNRFSFAFNGQLLLLLLAFNTNSVVNLWSQPSKTLPTYKGHVSSKKYWNGQRTFLPWKISIAFTIVIFIKSRPLL